MSNIFSTPHLLRQAFAAISDLVGLPALGQPTLNRDVWGTSQDLIALSPLFHEVFTEQDQVWYLRALLNPAAPLDPQAWQTKLLQARELNLRLWEKFAHVLITHAADVITQQGDDDAELAEELEPLRERLAWFHSLAAACAHERQRDLTGQLDAVLAKLELPALDALKAQLAQAQAQLAQAQQPQTQTLQALSQLDLTAEGSEQELDQLLQARLSAALHGAATQALYRPMRVPTSASPTPQAGQALLAATTATKATAEGGELKTLSEAEQAEDLLALSTSAQVLLAQSDSVHSRPGNFAPAATPRLVRDKVDFTPANLAPKAQPQAGHVKGIANSRSLEGQFLTSDNASQNFHLARLAHWQPETEHRVVLQELAAEDLDTISFNNRRIDALKSTSSSLQRLERSRFSKLNLGQVKNQVDYGLAGSAFELYSATNAQQLEETFNLFAESFYGDLRILANKEAKEYRKFTRPYFRNYFSPGLAEVDPVVFLKILVANQIYKPETFTRLDLFANWYQERVSVLDGILLKRDYGSYISVQTYEHNLHELSATMLLDLGKPDQLKQISKVGMSTLLEGSVLRAKLHADELNLDYTQMTPAERQALKAEIDAIVQQKSKEANQGVLLKAWFELAEFFAGIYELDQAQVDARIERIWGTKNYRPLESLEYNLDRDPTPSHTLLMLQLFTCGWDDYSAKTTPLFVEQTRSFWNNPQLSFYQFAVERVLDYVAPLMAAQGLSLQPQAAGAPTQSPKSTNASTKTTNKTPTKTPTSQPAGAAEAAGAVGQARAYSALGASLDLVAPALYRAGQAQESSGTLSFAQRLEQAQGDGSSFTDFTHTLTLANWLEQPIYSQLEAQVTASGLAHSQINHSLGFDAPRMVAALAANNDGVLNTGLAYKKNAIGEHAPGDFVFNADFDFSAAKLRKYTEAMLHVRPQSAAHALVLGVYGNDLSLMRSLYSFGEEEFVHKYCLNPFNTLYENFQGMVEALLRPVVTKYELDPKTLMSERARSYVGQLVVRADYNNGYQYRSAIVEGEASWIFSSELPATNLDKAAFVKALRNYSRQEPVPRYLAPEPESDFSQWVMARVLASTSPRFDLVPRNDDVIADFLSWQDCDIKSNYVAPRSGGELQVFDLPTVGDLKQLPVAHLRLPWIAASLGEISQPLVFKYPAAANAYQSKIRSAFSLYQAQALSDYNLTQADATQLEQVLQDLEPFALGAQYSRSARELAQERLALLDLEQDHAEAQGQPADGTSADAQTTTETGIEAGKTKATAKTASKAKSAAAKSAKSTTKASKSAKATVISGVPTAAALVEAYGLEKAKTLLSQRILKDYQAYQTQKLRWQASRAHIISGPAAYDRIFVREPNDYLRDLAQQVELFNAAEAYTALNFRANVEGFNVYAAAQALLAARDSNVFQSAKDGQRVRWQDVQKLAHELKQALKLEEAQAALAAHPHYPDQILDADTFANILLSNFDEDGMFEKANLLEVGALLTQYKQAYAQLWQLPEAFGHGFFAQEASLLAALARKPELFAQVAKVAYGTDLVSSRDLAFATPNLAAAGVELAPELPSHGLETLPGTSALVVEDRVNYLLGGSRVAQEIVSLEQQAEDLIGLFAYNQALAHKATASYDVFGSLEGQLLSVGALEEQANADASAKKSTKAKATKATKAKATKAKSAKAAKAEAGAEEAVVEQAVVKPSGENSTIAAAPAASVSLASLPGYQHQGPLAYASATGHILGYSTGYPAIDAYLVDHPQEQEKWDDFLRYYLEKFTLLRAWYQDDETSWQRKKFMPAQFSEFLNQFTTHQQVKEAVELSEWQNHSQAKRLYVTGNKLQISYVDEINCGLAIDQSWHYEVAGVDAVYESAYGDGIVPSKIFSNIFMLRRIVYKNLQNSLARCATMPSLVEQDHAYRVLSRVPFGLHVYKELKSLIGVRKCELYSSAGYHTPMANLFNDFIEDQAWLEQIQTRLSEFENVKLETWGDFYQGLSPVFPEFYTPDFNEYLWLEGYQASQERYLDVRNYQKLVSALGANNPSFNRSLSRLLTAEQQNQAELHAIVDSLHTYVYRDDLPELIRVYYNRNDELFTENFRPVAHLPVHVDLYPTLEGFNISEGLPYWQKYAEYFGKQGVEKLWRELVGSPRHGLVAYQVPPELLTEASVAANYAVGLGDQLAYSQASLVGQKASVQADGKLALPASLNQPGVSLDVSKLALVGWHMQANWGHNDQGAFIATAEDLAAQAKQAELALDNGEEAAKTKRKPKLSSFVNFVAYHRDSWLYRLPYSALNLTESGLSRTDARFSLHKPAAGDADASTASANKTSKSPTASKSTSAKAASTKAKTAKAEAVTQSQTAKPAQAAQELDHRIDGKNVVDFSQLDDDTQERVLYALEHPSTIKTDDGLVILSDGLIVAGLIEANTSLSAAKQRGKKTVDKTATRSKAKAAQPEAETSDPALTKLTKAAPKTKRLTKQELAERSAAYKVAQRFQLLTAYTEVDFNDWSTAVSQLSAPGATRHELVKALRILCLVALAKGTMVEFFQVSSLPGLTSYLDLFFTKNRQAHDLQLEPHFSFGAEVVAASAAKQDNQQVIRALTNFMVELKKAQETTNDDVFALIEAIDDIKRINFLEAKRDALELAQRFSEKAKTLDGVVAKLGKLIKDLK